jgi:hypothetical protein
MSVGCGSSVAARGPAPRLPLIASRVIEASPSPPCDDLGEQASRKTPPLVAVEIMFS